MATETMHGTLADVFVLRCGGTPQKSKFDYWYGDIPWLTPKDMANWTGDTQDHVTAEAIGNGTRLGAEDAIFIAVRGMSLHKEIRIVRPRSAIAFNQDVKALEPKDGENGEFLYYWLLSEKPRLLSLVDAAGHGTGRLATDRLEALSLPPLDDGQRSAATELLSALDRKIELLRKSISTTEAIIRTVFKAWFVDFLPVRAKAAGAASFRGVPQDVFDALPDGFEDSEIGEVPRGWEVGPVERLIDFNPKLSIKKGVAVEHLSMSDLPTDGPIHEEPSRKAFTSGAKFENDDTLLARITPCLENGKAAFVFGLDGTAFGSTEFIVLRPKPEVPSAFAYALARNDAFRDHAIRNMTGTSGRQRVSAEALQSYKIAEPSSKVLTAFADATDPLLSTIVNAAQQMRTLTSLRDTLLPKLMSGELTAPPLPTDG